MASICAIITALLCVATCCMHAVHACGPQLLYCDFNNHQGGFHSWNRGIAQSDFPVGLGYTKGIKRAEVGHGALRIKQPAGGVGPGGTGMLMRVNLPRVVTTATLSYRVKFDPGYDWTAGGKLPGLCDSHCPTGCVNMNKSPGWSSRIMFREGGRAESYMYYPNMKGFGTCGKSYLTSTAFTSGDWVDVKLFIKLNDGGSSNGEQKVWINGKQVLYMGGMRFRRSGNDEQIQQLKFEAFHGGKSNQFKPSKTQHIQFDYLQVNEGYCPPSGGGGRGTFHEESNSAVGDFLLRGDSIKEEDGGNKDSDTPDNMPDLPNNDDEIDDDDNDSNSHDCGDQGEEVCSWEQIQELGREWECDYGFHNNGQGICEPWDADKHS